MKILSPPASFISEMRLLCSACVRTSHRAPVLGGGEEGVPGEKPQGTVTGMDSGCLPAWLFDK